MLLFENGFVIVKFFKCYAFCKLYVWFLKTVAIVSDEFLNVLQGQISCTVCRLIQTPANNTFGIYTLLHVVNIIFKVALSWLVGTFFVRKRTISYLRWGSCCSPFGTSVATADSMPVVALKTFRIETKLRLLQLTFSDGIYVHLHGPVKDGFPETDLQ